MDKQYNYHNNNNNNTNNNNDNNNNTKHHHICQICHFNYNINDTKEEYIEEEEEEEEKDEYDYLFEGEDNLMIFDYSSGKNKNINDLNKSTKEDLPKILQKKMGETFKKNDIKVLVTFFSRTEGKIYGSFIGWRIIFYNKKNSIKYNPMLNIPIGYDIKNDKYNILRKTKGENTATTLPDLANIIINGITHDKSVLEKLGLETK